LVLSVLLLSLLVVVVLFLLLLSPLVILVLSVLLLSLLIVVVLLLLLLSPLVILVLSVLLLSLLIVVVLFLLGLRLLFRLAMLFARLVLPVGKSSGSHQHKRQKCCAENSNSRHGRHLGYSLHSGEKVRCNVSNSSKISRELVSVL
jgi:hypothetical protein